MSAGLWLLVVLVAIIVSGVSGYFLGVLAGEQIGQSEAEARIGRTQAERTSALLRAGRSRRGLKDAEVVR